MHKYIVGNFIFPSFELTSSKLDEKNVLQPMLAKCDRQIKRVETSHFSIVARIMSGNEKVVKVDKHCRLIEKGPNKYRMDLKTLDVIWIAWDFGISFVLNAVL